MEEAAAAEDSNEAESSEEIVQAESKGNFECIFPTVVCVLLEIDELIFEKSSNEGKTFLVLRSTSLAINPHSLEI